MFLSKIKVDLGRWDVFHDLRDRDRLHKKLLQFFPDYMKGNGVRDARQRFGILFRAEGQSILLQSRIEPHPATAPQGYSVIGTKDVTEPYASLLEGVPYHFLLEANTSIVVEKEGKLKRIGCGSLEKRWEWLAKRAEISGFEVVDAVQSPRMALSAGKFRLEVGAFEGKLKIRNLEAFRLALAGGIGRGKAYGLGLLSISR